MIRRTLIAMLVGGLVVATDLTASQTPPPTPPPGQTQTPPVPKPFPGSNPNSGQPPAKPTPPPAQTPDKPAVPPQTPPVQPAANAAPAGTPNDASLGVKIFPGATFLESFDAGRGQRLYLFGTNAPYLDVVTFYKRELRGGVELFRAPPMLQFELPGVKFQKETMAYPPSVTVKDYSWSGVSGELKEGYVFVDGTTAKRFLTIIQIVTPPGK